MRSVGYNDDIGRFVYTPDDDIIKCQKCGRAAEYGQTIIIQWAFRNGQMTEYCYCGNCQLQGTAGIQDQIFPAMVLSDLPEHFIMIPRKPLNMRVAGDTFTLALSNKGIKADSSGMSEPKAAIQSWEGARIGKTTRQLLQETRNDGKIWAILEGKPIIPDNQKGE